MTIRVFGVTVKRRFLESAWTRNNLAVSTLLFLALLLAGPGDVAAEEEGPPLLVTAERLTIEGEKNIAVFSGDVRAVRENMTVRSRELVVHYRSSPGSAEGSGLGEVDRVTAKGDVEIFKEGRRVTGDEADFFAGERKVVVTGHAVLEDGKNRIEGDRIVYRLDENVGMVEGSEKKRVKATLFPDKK